MDYFGLIQVLNSAASSSRSSSSSSSFSSSSTITGRDQREMNTSNDSKLTNWFHWYLKIKCLKDFYFNDYGESSASMQLENNSRNAPYALNLPNKKKRGLSKKDQQLKTKRNIRCFPIIAKILVTLPHIFLLCWIEWRGGKGWGSHGKPWLDRKIS